jgi:hypothetical protein
VVLSFPAISAVFNLAPIYFCTFASVYSQKAECGRDTLFSRLLPQCGMPFAGSVHALSFPVASLGQSIETCLHVLSELLVMVLMLHVHRMRDMQVLGACSCNEGWGGPDCSVALSEPSWPPAWFVYAAVGASTVISMVLWLASRQLLSDYIQRRRQAQEESQAMLVRAS